MKKKRAFLTSVAVLILFSGGRVAVGAESSPAFDLYDIGTSSPAPKTVIIRWTTDVLANSQVEYGLDESYGNRSNPDLTQVFSHAVRMTHLKPGLIYFYRVISTDAAGNRMVSPRFVFASPALSSQPAGGSAPLLTFTTPRKLETLRDETVLFTYQINGDWPTAERIPHVYVWADELRNGTWVERTRAFDIGGENHAALRSGSFSQKFSPGTYRVDGLLASYHPKHEALPGGGIVPVIFTVWNKNSTEVTTSSSSPLLALPSGPKLKSGDRIRNWRAADVRQVPSRSNSLIGTQAPDTKGAIIGGPEGGDGSRWWNINYDVGYDGWTSEDSLLPVHAPVFDFELVGLEDNGVTAKQGSSADFSLGGRLTSGTGQLVAFSAHGIPAGAYGVFSPASCTLPCLTTLHISTARTTPTGTHPVTITAISAKKEKKISFKMRVTRHVPAPSVSLTAPFLEDVVPGSDLVLSSAVIGEHDSGVRAIRFHMDGGRERRDASLNGSRVFGGLQTGPHMLDGYLLGSGETKIAGTDFALPFMSNSSLPVVSGVNSRGITDASAIIVWNTDTNSTARVRYDGVQDMRFSTPELDIGGIQQTHTVGLENLIPCTNYPYRVYSKNADGEEGTGLVNRFSTSGCLAPLLPDVHAEGVLSDLPQRTLSLVRDDERSVRVTLPAEFPETAAIQINGLDPRAIGTATPAPTSQARLVGNHAYRMVVLKNPSTSIFTSDKPVSIAMHYLREDVQDIVPGTLKIWRWTGVDWTETSQCRTNDESGEISCATNELSSFALFGASSRFSVGPPSGSLTYPVPPLPAPVVGVVDNLKSSTVPTIPLPPGGKPNISVIPKPAATPKTPVARSLTVKSIPTVPADARSLTRDLYRGIKHPEVKLLQQFLISRTYLGAGSDSGFFDGVTETALKKFQCDQEIVCKGTQSTTGYGSVDARTRDKINFLLK